MNTQNKAKIYELRLKGHLGQSTLVWFEGLSAEYGAKGETVLRGPIVDDAALHGLLTRIRDLGLSLTFLQVMDEIEENHESQ